MFKFILSICMLGMAVGLSPIGGSGWEYIEQGTSKQYSSSAGWSGMVNGMFYTQQNAKIELSCQAYLPCGRQAYIRVYNSGGYMVGQYCTQGSTSEQISISIYYAMAMEMSAGSFSIFGPASSYSCTVKAFVPQASQCNCGTNNVNKIVNGVDAAEGEIPWQVALGTGYLGAFSSFCGGTLLSKDFVVTAAHCIKNTDTNVKIFMGSRNIQSTSAKVFGVSGIRQHEQYVAQPPTNDIAMIRLANSAVLSSLIYPACLPRNYYAETFAGKPLLVSGWGTLTEGSNSQPNILKKTTVQGITNSQCSSSYSSIKDTMLCAYTVNTDSCQGDSGGPLTYKNNGVTVLAGIVSYGNGCARPNYPGVYTRVTSFLPWIDYIIGDSFCSK